VQNRHIAFSSYPELHIPALDYPERALSEDVTAHAWLQYVGEAYSKFLIQGDDAQFDDEEDAFRQTVGASPVPASFASTSCSKLLIMHILRNRAEGSRQAQRLRLDELRAERDELEQQWKELTARPVRSFSPSPHLYPSCLARRPP
jgi:hypothetical protein